MAITVAFRIEAIANFRVITALEISFLVLFLLTKLFQDAQRVYVVFRYFRNKIYQHDLKPKYVFDIVFLLALKGYYSRIFKIRS